jgi:ethanolamine transporter EutH
MRFSRRASLICGMAFPWGLIVFLIGIAYGWLSPGRQDKSYIFKQGLLWGLVVAIVVAILGYFFGLNPLGLGDVSFLNLLISFIVLTLVFMVGVWLGDMIEGRRATRGGLRRL